MKKRTKIVNSIILFAMIFCINVRANDEEVTSLNKDMTIHMVASILYEDNDKIISLLDQYYSKYNIKTTSRSNEIKYGGFGTTALDNSDMFKATLFFTQGTLKYKQGEFSIQFKIHREKGKFNRDGDYVIRLDSFKNKIFRQNQGENSVVIVKPISPNTAKYEELPLSDRIKQDTLNYVFIYAANEAIYDYNNKCKYWNKPYIPPPQGSSYSKIIDGTYKISDPILDTDTGWIVINVSFEMSINGVMYSCNYEAKKHTDSVNDKTTHFIYENESIVINCLKEENKIDNL